MGKYGMGSALLYRCFWHIFKYRYHGVVATADVEVLVSSFLLSTAIGDEGTEGNASVQLESLSLSVSIGPVEAIIIQGSQMTTGTGLVDIQAGGNIYIQVDEHTITTSAGQATADAGASVAVSGISLGISLGEEVVDAITIAAVTGSGLSAVVNSVDAVSVVEVTGTPLTISLGEEEAITDVTVSVTGSALSLAINSVDAVSVAEVTGSSLATSIASVTTTGNAIVSLVGINLAIRTSAVDTIVWTEVDTGVEVTWYDIAA
jgi:hypothetical protein